MNWEDKPLGEAEDEVVASALRNFKASVDAWSTAAYVRPRASAGGRRSWRLAASWALGCAVIATAGSSAFLYQRHQSTMNTRGADVQILQPANEASGTQSAVAQSSDDDLLATVDSEISRQVPSAMDPLAQMMEDETKQ